MKYLGGQARITRPKRRTVQSSRAGAPEGVEGLKADTFLLVIT